MTLGMTVVAMFFLAMGVAALVAPARILAPFGISVTSRDGRNEVRAVYGGYGIAIFVLLWIAGRSPGLRDGILVCVAGSMAGMAGGRLVSAALERSMSFVPILFLAIEVALAVTVLLQVRRLW